MTSMTIGGPSPKATHKVATEVRSLMARYNVVQEDLTAVLGLSQAAVSKRLRGITPWDINEIAAVAEFFGMTAGALIAEAMQPRPESPSGPRKLAHPAPTRRRSTRKPATAQYPDLPIDLRAHRLRRTSRSSTGRAGLPYVGNLPRRAA